MVSVTAPCNIWDSVVSFAPKKNAPTWNSFLETLSYHSYFQATSNQFQFKTCKYLTTGITSAMSSDVPTYIHSVKTSIIHPPNISILSHHSKESSTTTTTTTSLRRFIFGYFLETSSEVLRPSTSSRSLGLPSPPPIQSKGCGEWRVLVVVQNLK